MSSAFRLLCVVAEPQMIPVLRAAGAGFGAAIAFDGLPAETLAHLPVDRLEERLGHADALFVSMVNTDREVRILAAALTKARPAVTVVLHSQPELLAATRLLDLDAGQLAADRALVGQITGRLQAAGVNLPPVWNVILSAAPRLEAVLSAQGWPGLAAYARIAQYWGNGTPENVRRLIAALARAAGRPDWSEPPPPALLPATALWHPAAGQHFADLDAYWHWYREYRGSAGENAATPPAAGRPRAGVIVFRQYVASGNCGHYAAAITALEAAGLDVIAGYGNLDHTQLVETCFRPAGIDVLVNLTGFNLVGSMGQPRPQRAVELLQSLDVPYLVAVPLLFQTQEGWKADRLGLSPAQTALQVVLPELEGGIEPRVYGGRTADDRQAPDPNQVGRLARRAARWTALRRKPPAERRIALTLFSFPPDKGSIGSAAYLDVFRSLHNTLAALREAGCRVDLPPDAEALRRAVIAGSEAPVEGLSGGPRPDRLLRMTDAAVAGRLSVWQYKRLFPAWKRLAAIWGEPPGLIDATHDALLIRGRAFGNVFIGIQPSFGYEGDPMRLLFSPEASPSHSFAAFYTWLAHVWQADCLIHFGTHGALEFMPGKSVGLTADCYPDLLLGDLPHAYFYSIDNPSEASIAKRRSYAELVSYLSPPLSAAGLYRDLRALRESADEWATASPRPRRDAACAAVQSLVDQTGIAREVPPPDWRDDRAVEDFLGRLRAYLQELAERLIPIGLHVAGEAPDTAALETFLAAEARIERPEKGIRSLPALLGENLAGAAGGASAGGCAAVVSALVREGPAAAENAARAAQPALGSGPAAADLAAWIDHAVDLKDRLTAQEEIPALVRALGGGYVPPSPGGDPIRSPEVLPAGRNLHALDPYSVPSAVARQTARAAIDALLGQLRGESGDYPESIALVLWGTDNIKSGGEGVAQALALLGAEPVADSLGRLTRVRLIPLSELGRPRIDVVMTISGIFRDLFPTVIELLDEAVRLAAAAEEPEDENFVRRRTRQAAEALGLDPRLAAARLFSNAAGMYGTGVNHLVEASAWEARSDLGAVFLHRKSFAYGLDVAAEAQEALFTRLLAGVAATFQNLDSTEISLSDVDHYYEYLGGLNAAVVAAGGERPRSFIADGTGPVPRVRLLEQAVAVESRTRLLNPRWYEGMLKHGYQGVHEVAVRLENTFGWSATSDAVDPWVYRDAARTFLLDDVMQQRLASLNAAAARRIAARVTEAADRGFWQPEREEYERLLEIENRLSDVMEGVVSAS